MLPSLGSGMSKYMRNTLDEEIKSNVKFPKRE